MFLYEDGHLLVEHVLDIAGLDGCLHEHLLVVAELVEVQNFLEGLPGHRVHLDVLLVLEAQRLQPPHVLADLGEPGGHLELLALDHHTEVLIVIHG